MSRNAALAVALLAVVLALTGAADAALRVVSKPRPNAVLKLDPGWAEGMSINEIEPSPVNEASDNGRLSLELGHIPAGKSFLLFMQFQVNPTNVAWHRPQNVETTRPASCANRAGDPVTSRVAASAMTFTAAPMDPAVFRHRRQEQIL